MDAKKFYDYLDSKIKGQHLAKKRMVAAVMEHYYSLAKQGQSKPKPNILLVGPTGSGKTFLLECMAEFLPLCVKIVNAAALVPAAYKGKASSELFEQLKKECGDNIERAECAIIALDEIDKRKDRNSAHEDVGTMVQQELLASVSGTEVGGLKTHNMLFVAMGAFVGLTDIVRARLGNPNLLENDALDALSPADFEAFGMVPELLGRFPIRIYVGKLSREDFVDFVRSSKDSIIGKKQRFFEDFGFDLRITEEAIQEMANQAFLQGLGMRALQSIISDACDELVVDLKELYQKGTTQIEITGDVIRKKAKPKAIRPERKKSNATSVETERKLEEFMRRIKADSSQTDNGHGADAGDSGGQNQQPPFQPGGPAQPFFPFTEQEKRDLQKIIQASKNQPPTTPLLTRLFKKLKSWRPSDGWGNAAAKLIKSRDIFPSLLRWVVVYVLVIALGYGTESHSVAHYFRILTAGDEFSIWHVAGFALGSLAYSFHRYRPSSHGRTSVGINILAVAAYSAIIALSARSEIFCYHHATLAWSAFLDHALWRDDTVTGWSYLAAALALYLIFGLLNRDGEEPLGPMVWVFRRFSGRGPMEFPNDKNQS